jgi:hypothetical protein
MKLRMLVAVALGAFALPAYAHAQAKDTTMNNMNMGNATAAHDSITRDAGAGPQTAGCPLGCPTSKGAAGLTGVQFLALQQELRDRRCGNNRVTGVLDAPTRRAISKCAKRYGVANNAKSLLESMQIGFSNGETPGASSGT